MEGWQWTPGVQQGGEWNLGGGQAGDGSTQQGSLEGVDSLPEAMAKSKQEASRRVSRSNSKQFERMASQVSLSCHIIQYQMCMHNLFCITTVTCPTGEMHAFEGVCLVSRHLGTACKRYNNKASL